MSRSAFVIDDEIFIALDIEGHLSEMGFDILGPAFTLEEGHALIASAPQPPVLALMDINIRGDLVWPLAKILSDLGTNIIFVSANHSHRELETDFKNCQVLDKPVSRSCIADAIRTVGLSAN